MSPLSAALKSRFAGSDPRRAVRFTLAALGVFASAAIAWFWLQWQTPAPLGMPNPPRPAGEPQREAAPAPAVAPAPPRRSPEPANVERPAPPTAAARRVAARPVHARTEHAKLEDAPPPPPSRSVRRLAETSAATPGDAVQSDARAEPAIHPQVAAGYEAYRSGRLAAAREAYARALHEEPANRDAQLGLAAVEMRLGHAEAAEDLYARRLQADPRDPHAQAGLVALRGAQADPIATETRIKMLLAANPEVDALNFALGNQYAQQGRWAEARQAYLKAYGADAENADFAYNLAVSLDHLRQAKTALDYYRRAIELAAKHSVAFDPHAAEARAQELAR